MRAIFVLLAATVLLVGCGEDDAAVNTPYVENYSGTYMVRNTTEVILSAKIDSVAWTVTNGATYSMRFSVVDSNDDIDFCDCDGTLPVNTSNNLRFEPLVILGSNCDTLRIPRGDFTPDYFYHRPDTIYFEKRIGDSLYQLIVLPD